MSSLIVCHACDLVHRLDSVPMPARIRCVRCRAELYRTSTASLDAALAWAVCALVFYVLANAYPLVAIELGGATRSTTLAGAALGLYQHGYPAVGALVAFTTIVVPLAQVLLFLSLLLAVRGRGLRARHLVWFRQLAPLAPWTMVEVFLLGALVALTKLSDTARIEPGIALLSYGLLMLALSALASATPREQIWRWVAERR